MTKRKKKTTKNKTSLRRRSSTRTQPSRVRVVNLRDQPVELHCSLARVCVIEPRGVVELTTPQVESAQVQALIHRNYVRVVSQPPIASFHSPGRKKKSSSGASKKSKEN